MKKHFSSCAVVMISSLVCGATFAACPPRMNYNLNYRTQYEQNNKRTDYRAFKDSRIQSENHLRHRVEYNKTPNVSVSGRHDTHRADGQWKMSYTPDNLSPFNAIVADGDTIVILNGGKAQSVKITSKKAFPTRLIDVSVRNHTLYVSRHNKRSWQAHAQQPVYVNVDMPQVRHLTLKGQARVMGYNIRSTRGLSIRSDSSTDTKLQGMINLTDLCHTGSGRMEIEWVNSDQLRVRSCDCSRIKLAGTVQTLNIRSTGHAHVDARYLRAHAALVQTADAAEVDITAIDALSGFASDFSNIKYFKTPKHLTSHTYASGNVMQMKYWN